MKKFTDTKKIRRAEKLFRSADGIIACDAVIISILFPVGIYRILSGLSFTGTVFMCVLLCQNVLTLILLVLLKKQLILFTMKRESDTSKKRAFY